MGEIFEFRPPAKKEFPDKGAENDNAARVSVVKKWPVAGGRESGTARITRAGIGDAAPRWQPKIVDPDEYWTVQGRS